MGASIVRAMRRFLARASRPYLLVPLTILFALLPVGAPVAAALLVFDTLRRGAIAAGVAGLITILGLVLIGSLLGTPLALTLSMTAPVILGGVLCGALLQSSRSLSAAFQATVGGVIAGSVLLFLIVPATRQVGDLLRDQFLLVLENAADGTLLSQLASVSSVDFVRVYLMTLLGSLLSGLMLGMWWFSLVTDGIGFGAHFRALQLGRPVGIALMVLAIAGSLASADLIQYVAPLAVIGFLFQGLAVFHSRNYSEKWHPGVAIALYIALFSFSPFTGLALMGLSAVGLIDNFFELRAKSEPGE